MKKILVFVFCIFILPFYLSANAYGAETDDLEPWEISIQNAETLLSDGSVEDAYREALTTINLYLSQTEFEAESFISMIRRVKFVAGEVGGREGRLIVITAAISVAERVPVTHANALIDLWLMMASEVTDNERDDALKNALDISKNIYSPAYEKIIEVYERVLFLDMYVHRQYSHAEKILIEMSKYISSNFAEGDPIKYRVDIARIQSMVIQKINSRSRRKNWSEEENMTLSLFDKLEVYGQNADEIRYDAYVELAKIYINDGREDKVDGIISKISDMKIPGEKSYKPILKPQPLYPRQAQEMTLGGIVDLLFCIDESGNTFDIEAVDTKINTYGRVVRRVYNYFEQPSIWAVRKFKYIPTFIDGVAVAECGIHNDIVYEMEP